MYISIHVLQSAPGHAAFIIIDFLFTICNYKPLCVAVSLQENTFVSKVIILCTDCAWLCNAPEAKVQP